MPLRDDLLNPIPGENPSGPNLKYAPVYDQIKEARREEDDAEQGIWQRQRKTADYPLVVKLASEALARKSKDLQIAAWLTEAIVHREGFAGLQQGLDLVVALLNSFWDTIHPELEDGDAELRAMPLAWIGSSLDGLIRSIPLTSQGFGWRQYRDSRAIPTEEEAGSDEAKLNARKEAIADGKATPEEFDAAAQASSKAFYEALTQQVRKLQETVETLDSFCAEKFGRDAPSFSGLRECLEQVGNTVRILLLTKGGAPPEEAEPVEEEAPPPADERVDEQQPVAARAPAKRRMQGAEPADRDDAIDRLCAVARWFRRQEPASPVPYLLLRGLRWGELRAGGEFLDHALLEAPSTEIRQELKRLSQEGQWAAALEAAEEAAGKPCGRGWLDLQRYVVTACEQQGFGPIAKAVQSGLNALLSDYPQLLEATLTDDTQAANAQTRELFAIQPKPEPAPPPAEPAYEFVARQEETPQDAPKAPDDEELIRDAVRRGRTQEAIELVTQRLTQETSGRGRFHRRVQLAQVCLAAGRETIAYNILRELAIEIEARKLEQWEAPTVVAHPLSLLYRCLEHNGATSEEKEKVYTTICRIDPMQALDLSR